MLTLAFISQVLCFFKDFIEFFYFLRFQFFFIFFQNFLNIRGNCIRSVFGPLLHLRNILLSIFLLFKYLAKKISKGRNKAKGAHTNDILKRICFAQRRGEKDHPASYSHKNYPWIHNRCNSE